VCSRILYLYPNDLKAKVYRLENGKYTIEGVFSYKNTIKPPKQTPNDANTGNYDSRTQAQYEQSSLEYALDNNLTTTSATGLALTEVPISYAHAFDVAKGKLSVGASIKLMHGTTYTQTLSVDSKDATDEDTLKNNQKDSNNVGLDVGLLFQPSSFSDLTVGLVAKNLNSPSFDTAEGGSIDADLQVRTGIQYVIRDDLEFAADLDLTSNKTLINGYDSQIIGGGLNYHPLSWFAIRGGAMQNMANSNDGLVYTAGLSLGVSKLKLDISAQMASKTGEYEGEDIPKYANVNVALVSTW